MRRLCLVLPLAFFLSACATSGRNFDESQVSNIRNGQTTKAEIEAWFGQPGSHSALNGTSNGAVLRYIYSFGYASHGGRRSTGKALVVDFDNMGIVVENAYAEK